jgi:hypothetical protein
LSDRSPWEEQQQRGQDNPNVTTTRVVTRGSTALEKKVKTRIEGFYLLLDVVGGSWGGRKKEAQSEERKKRKEKREREKMNSD